MDLMPGGMGVDCQAKRGTGVVPPLHEYPYEAIDLEYSRDGKALVSDNIW